MAKLPKSWKEVPDYPDVYESKGQLVKVHKPNDEQYIYLRDSNTFQVSGKVIKSVLDSVGSMADKRGSRPIFQSVWGFNSTPRKFLDAPNGVWVAADGYQLMTLAHDGDPITTTVNINPILKQLIPNNSEVTLGTGGVAFRDKDGNLLEADALVDMDFPDYQRVFPQGDPIFTFQLFDVPIPNSYLALNAPYMVELEADRGKVQLIIRDLEDKDKPVLATLNIGESDDVEYQGFLAGINMKFLNNVIRMQPAAGHWEMDVRTPTSPLVVRHSSRKAEGLIMPMHINGRYSKV